MENKILVLTCIVNVLLLYLLNYYRNKANKIYKESDKLLDKILENSYINQIEINEGKTSALANKINKVQEKLLIETGRAENEKEEIKRLISNMSHQLKTPLANIIMYEDILIEKLKDPQVQKFLYKMKDQTNKIDWILNSLFKMVKLEQNALDFNIENNSIKNGRTIKFTRNSFMTLIKPQVRFLLSDFLIPRIQLPHSVQPRLGLRFYQYEPRCICIQVF